MTDPRGRRRWRSRAALVMAVGLLLGLVAPAGAQTVTEAGTGAGEGEETVLDSDPNPGLPLPVPCLEIRHGDDYEGSQYVIDAHGTYTAADEGAVYAGDLTITIDSTDTYWIGPQGTHGPDAEGACGPGNLGPLAPVPAQITVEGTGQPLGDGSVGSCTGTGHFYRLNTTFVAEWDAECFVDGNVPGLAGEGTPDSEHRFVGNHQPCFDFSDDDPCHETELYGSYTQTLRS